MRIRAKELRKTRKTKEENYKAKVKVAVSKPAKKK